MNSIEKDNMLKHSSERHSPENNRVIDVKNTIVVSNKEHGGRFIDKIKRLFEPKENK